MIELWSDLRTLSILSITVRFLMACLFGGLIGFERGRHKQAAGLRTHMMVCVGAASTMMVSEYAMIIAVAAGATGDMLRIGAQVVSGIGFLGAGTILVTKQNRIRGLTTAASLWASACMGLVIGIGFYECAIIMILVMLFVLLVLGGIDVNFVKSSAHVSIFLEVERGYEFSEILHLLRQQGWNIQDIREMDYLSSDYLALRIDMLSDDTVKRPQLLLEELRELEQVHFIERL